MCKHLTALLSNKRWLVKVASIVNEYIKAYPDDIRKQLGLSEDEFIVNVPGRPSSKTGRNTRMLNKDDELEPSVADINNIINKKKDNYSDEDDEELEPAIDDNENEEED